MKANWGESLNQLKSSLQQLRDSTAIPDNLTYQGHPITFKDIIKSFEQLIKQFDATTTSDVDAVLCAVHTPGVVGQIPSLVSTVSAFINVSGAAPYTDQLVSQIWSIYNSLSWILPSDYSKKALLPTLHKGSKSQLAELEQINEKLKKSFETINSSNEILEKAKEQADEIVSQIEKDALEASNAKANAESNVIQSTVSKDKFEQLINDIELGKSKSDALLIHLDQIKNKADDTLGSVSQVALAKSWESRKIKLEKSQDFWIKSFILGLVCMAALIMISIIYSDFYRLPSIIANGHFEAWGALIRVLLVSPIVWFTWFAGREFSKNALLIEDYAFKEASAFAFVGYKNDMEDAAEMLNLLRESAIRNFAYPPSRLISTNEPSSPMHELFDKVLKDDGVFDKFVAMLKALKPGKD